MSVADRAGQHDPEKWEPVFGKDHAQTSSEDAVLMVMPL